VIGGLKSLLGYVPLYVALQRAVGADRLRYRCIGELNLRPGDRVLDIGCGPAYYAGHLDNGVRYTGFDTSARYVAHARRRYGGADRTFHCGRFGAAELETLEPVDAVLLFGLLHHLSDVDARDLLDLAGRALAPGGRVVSVDPCFEPTQGRVSRWMSANDRGGYVREPAGFSALGREWFGDVTGTVLADVTRVPSSHWMMVSRAPLRVAARG
jgi:SAM-dependent methyltransferase